MAFDSIPPPFDMSYRPENRTVFGPPKGSWVFPAVYVAVAAAFALTAEFSRFAPQDGWFWHFFVELDGDRIISARTFALLLGISALASLLRTGMRGVHIHSDGIEARGALVLGWPRVKNCEWVEIEQLSFEPQAVGIHLWDGSILWLPPVADRDGLEEQLERVGSLRRIPMRRGERMAAQPVEA